MLKASAARQDPYLAMLDHRNTPSQGRITETPEQEDQDPASHEGHSAEARGNTQQTGTGKQQTETGKVLQPRSKIHGHSGETGQCENTTLWHTRGLETSEGGPTGEP